MGWLNFLTITSFTSVKMTGLVNLVLKRQVMCASATGSELNHCPPGSTVYSQGNQPVKRKGQGQAVDEKDDPWARMKAKTLPF